MKVYPNVNCCSEGGNVMLMIGWLKLLSTASCCSDDGHITTMIGG